MKTASEVKAEQNRLRYEMARDFVDEVLREASVAVNLEISSPAGKRRTEFSVKNPLIKWKADAALDALVELGYDVSFCGGAPGELRIQVRWD